MGESSATEIRLWRKKYKFRTSEGADGIPAGIRLQARGLAGREGGGARAAFRRPALPDAIASHFAMRIILI
jgi:hypothetical protein